MKDLQFTVRSLSAQRVPDKLAQGGVELLSARKTAKNEITFTVSGKDREKVFAILRGTCYNVVKVRERGLALFYKKCRQHAGLVLGALLFCLLVAGFQSRVLRIDVVGNGAYYEREVLEVLHEGGIRPLSPRPKEYAALTARILSLPRVSFCEIKCTGGILTVEVRVNGEGSPLTEGALLAPVAGKVEELTVLRGTACVAVGEEVTQGQTLVDNYVLLGEERREVRVIARAKLSYPVSREYAGTEESARSQAYLDFGADSVLTFTPTQTGFLAEGTAYASAAVNLD